MTDRALGRAAVPVVALAIAVLGSLVAANLGGEWSDRAVRFGVLALLCLSWQVVAGYAGQLSLLHGAWFGIGSLTTTLLYNAHGLTPLLGVLVSAAIAVVLALIAGAALSRRSVRGLHYALATLAISTVLAHLARYAPTLQERSLVVVTYDPAPVNLMFETRTPYIAVIFVLVALGWLASRSLVKSRLGRAMIAVRQNEVAAGALAIDVARTKTIALALSTLGAVTAGAFSAFYYLSVDVAGSFSLDRQVEVLVATMLGGIGSAGGAIVGAGAFMLLDQAALRLPFDDRTLVTLVPFVSALVLAAVVALLPQGIVGTVQGRIQERKERTMQIRTEEDPHVVDAA